MKPAEFTVRLQIQELHPVQAGPTSRSVKLPSSFRGLGPIAWLPLLVLPSVAFLFQLLLRPWMFMWTLAISTYLGLKWLTWWKVRNLVPHSTWRSPAYLLAWPGMNAASFLDDVRHPPVPPFRSWLWATLETGIGAFLLWFLARSLPPELPLLRGWVGMFGLILLLHFGTFELAALSWQSLGVDAKPIMSAPLRSKSLSEFWGRRWNLGFRQLAHDLVFIPLHKSLPAAWAALAVFFVSGLIHDLVISVPARAGYGLPTCYFLLQGFGVLLERSTVGKQFGLDKGVRGWLFMLLVVAGPVFWLFHPPFVMRVVIPFMRAIHAL